MDFKEGIETRRSIRKYTQQEIPDEALRECVRLASFSPSWKNSQCVSYMIIKDKALKDEIAEKAVAGFVNNTKTITRATALCIVLITNGISGYNPDGTFSTSKGSGWEMFDAGIASQTFCLAAHSLGIGTVILGYLDDAKVAELAGIPEGKTAAAFIAMGYPEKIGPMPRRKTVDELLEIKK